MTETAPMQGMRGKDLLIIYQSNHDYAGKAHRRETIQGLPDDIRVGLGPRNATTAKSRGNRPIYSASLVKFSHPVRVYLPPNFSGKTQFIPPGAPPRPARKIKKVNMHKHNYPTTGYILIALKEFPEKSQTQIAEQIGCSHVHVGNIKRELQVVSSDHLTPESTSDAQLPDRVIGKDGKSYPARREQAEQTEASMEHNRTHVLKEYVPGTTGAMPQNFRRYLK